MLLDLSCAATSARTTKGNFDDINFVSAKLFPRLSDNPWSLTSPDAPAGHAPPKATMHTSVAKSSKDAMVL